MQLRNLLKCTILLPDTEKSQTAPLGTVWDFYDDHKYIPYNMESSYLRSLVTRWRFELQTHCLKGF